MADGELQQIGSYTITRLLTESSSSRLYLGRHQQRKKDAVIKVFSTTPLTTREARDVFLARAKLLKTKLRHRYIAEIQDFGMLGDEGYLAMQYLPGGTIVQRFAAGGCYAPDEVKRVLSPIADALHYAHVNTILHGNLHPGNLLISERSEVLLTDFSLLLAPFEDKTPALLYRAPEHLRGTITAASDQYSLAVMAYEWLCGRRPYKGTNREALLHQQEHEAFPLPHILNGTISPAVERVLLQALAFKPEERFAQTQAFADAYLHALMGLPIRSFKHSGTQGTVPPLSISITDNNNNSKQVNLNTGDEGTFKNTLRRQDTNKDNIELSLSTHLSPNTNVDKDVDVNNKMENSEAATLTCATCGAANRVNAKHCSTCGTILQPIPPSPSTVTGLGTPISNNLFIRHYHILNPLGQGGYGAVYLAQDTQLERRVAIKEMTLDGLDAHEISQAAQAFQGEAKLLANLEHVSIPPIYEHFSVNNRWYLVMKYIKGETLERYLEKASEGRLSIEEVLYIGIQLCAVLGYLHDQKPPIIFRDLKPANIMWKPEKQFLYLIDFGIARHFKSEKIKDTKPLGTPGYAAPEQFGKKQTTHKSDIYSLGATLHHLLSGNAPSQTPFHFAPLQFGGQPILARLETLIMQMLDMDESKRPESVTIIKQQLEDIRNQLSGMQINNMQFGALNNTPFLVNPGQLILRPNGGTIHNAITEVMPQYNSISDDALISGQAPSQSATPIEESHLQNIVSADLRQGGVLSKRLPGYEEREAQIEMAALVAKALTEEVPAIVEAATGTGKSLAYLLPIVRSNKVAIISTANKALQEQLFYKDIPFVQKHIKPFPAALIKGMANYLCLDRMESERQGIQYYVKNRDFLRLINITEDPESSFDGDFETLGFQLPAEIRSKVHADSDQCAWSKCNFFSDCYVRQMRVKASNAQVMVVNHTLLLIDAAMEGFLLPKRDLIIVDEAHHLEEEATSVFTVTISQARISTLLAQRMLKDHSSVALQDEAVKAMEDTWRKLEMVADPGFKNRANLYEPVEEGLRLATVIADLGESLRRQRPKDMPEKESNLYDKLVTRTENLALDIRTVFSVGQRGKFVYYAERVNTPGRRGGLLEISAAPLDVTPWLKKHLFDKSNVICTSATLATIGPNPQKPEDKGPNFAYFRSRTGLDFADYPDLIERILPLTFDYEHNALLYVPRHLPEPVYGPNSTDYMKAIAREMERLVEASRGRAFLLFSSKRMLEEVYEEFCQIMPMHLDFPLLRQGDMTRTELTRRFREEEGAVLFGLKSFWEGVDIAGEALSLVVIDKLPFDPPDDPVHEARVAQMKAAGENWFGTYVLPQAVLRLKQGLGRLLRTRDDRGVMAILDARLHTKAYGRLVINALPPARRTASLRDVEQFFAAEERAAF